MSPRVLVVDDDSDFAESTATLLRLFGHEVDLTYSGEEALEKFHAGTFDLTLMDVKMPDKNGVETLAAIRETTPDARVVIMTGFTMSELLEEAKANGAWMVLYKPLDIEKLRQLVDSI